MSRRPRQSAPGLSLFAFQDIIMSTSGIVIMMVLLLTLELVERKEGQENLVVRDDRNQIEAHITKRQQEIHELQNRIDQSDAIIQQASSISPSDLKEKVESLRLQNALLRNEVSALKDKLEIADATDAQAEANRDQLRSKQDQLAEMRRERTRLEAEIESVRRDERPIFSFPKGDQRSGWLVVVSENRIALAPIGRAARPLSFQSKGEILSLRSAVDQFLEWTSSQPIGAFYFFLIRPGGTNTFDRIRTKFDERQIQYGFDLAGLEQVILDPERGAAP